MKPWDGQPPLSHRRLSQARETPEAPEPPPRWTGAFLGVVGILLGVAGVLLGVVAWLMCG